VPATLHVGTGETYATISAALAQAGNGDTIKVDPGTYQEQVVIGKSISLVATGPAASTVIKAPTGLSGSVVDISAANVMFKGFTVDAGGNAAGTIDSAVRIEDGASATVRDSHITGLFNGTNNQAGYGIRVGTDTTTAPTLAKIINDVIDDYQKGGIIVDGSGASAIVRDNTVTGAGPAGLVAQNGIQISNNATANVTFNTVTKNTYTGTDFTSTGILVYNDTANVVVGQNTVTNNEVGLTLDAVRGTVVTNNELSNNTLDGTDMFTVTGVLFRHNDVENNGVNPAGNPLNIAGDGVHIETSTNNDLRWNESEHNGANGYYLLSSTGNLLSADGAFGNGASGITLDGSSNNTIVFSVTTQNVSDGITLKNGSHNNTVEYNISAGNGGFGINVDASSTGNTISNNAVFDNGDGNYSQQLGVGGNNNTWQTYQSETSNNACNLLEDFVG
jgi:parallel beta-helix repeat protein